MDGTLVAMCFLLAVSITNYIGHKEGIGALQVCAILFLYVYIMGVAITGGTDSLPILGLGAAANTIFFAISITRN